MPPVAQDRGALGPALLGVLYGTTPLFLGLPHFKCPSLFLARLHPTALLELVQGQPPPGSLQWSLTPPLEFPCSAWSPAF